MIVDTHAHLYDPVFDRDRDEVIRRALREGVGAIIAVGTDLDSSRVSVELAQAYPWVYAAVGFHPHDASRLTPEALDEIASLAAHPKVVAIGEIGLDYYRKLSPKEAQGRALEAQLELASSLELPVIVHCRDAHAETLAILRLWAGRRSLKTGGYIGVMHCFSGDEREGMELIGMGFMVSFAGPVTFPRTQRPKLVAMKLPMTELLVETDCPYLTPSENYGQRNEPAFVWAVARGLAEAREIPLQEMASITNGNAQKLFGLSLIRKEDIGDPYPIPVYTGRFT